MSLEFNEEVQAAMDANLVAARSLWTEDLVENDFARAQWMVEYAISFDGESNMVDREIVATESESGLGLFTFNGEPICFFQGVAFHPGAQKAVSTVAGPSVPGSSSGAAQLAVIDTGWLNGNVPCRHADAESFPYNKDDLVTGHGPAIVDAARSVMGRGSLSRISLYEPRYLDGSLAATTFMPVVDEHDETKYVRAFDMTAAILAIESLLPSEPQQPWFQIVKRILALVRRRWPSVVERILALLYREGPEILKSGDVLSLSFGTTVADDAKIDPLRKVISTALDLGVHVVAAAGNHGVSPEPTAKSWPAAIDGVIAVGSGSETTPHDFSARGVWVTHCEDGRDVPVDIVGIANSPSGYPRPSGSPAQREATWSGTSFATPKVAARIARGGPTAIADFKLEHQTYPDWKS